MILILVQTFPSWFFNFSTLLMWIFWDNQTESQDSRFGFDVFHLTLNGCILFSPLGLGCSETWFSRSTHQMLVLYFLFWWKILFELGDIAPDSWKFMKKLDFPLIFHCNLHRRFGSNQGFWSNFQLSGAISPSSDNLFHQNKLLSTSIWCIFPENHVSESLRVIIRLGPACVGGMN